MDVLMHHQDEAIIHKRIGNHQMNNICFNKLKENKGHIRAI